MRNRREQTTRAYLDALERQVSELVEERRKLRRENARLADEASEATAAKEAAEAAALVFVAKTESGRILYEGDSQREAENVAKAHFWKRPYEHTVVTDDDGEVVFSSRKRGYVRKGGRLWPPVPA